MLLDLLTVLSINPLGPPVLRAGIESRKDLGELNEIADPNVQKPYLHDEVGAHYAAAQQPNGEVGASRCQSHAHNRRTSLQSARS
jgi:hypothetical protein